MKGSGAKVADIIGLRRASQGVQTINVLELGECSDMRKSLNHPYASSMVASKVKKGSKDMNNKT